MADGMCQGYVFICQKYKLNVKSVGGNSLEQTIREVSWWWKWKNTYQLTECKPWSCKLRWLKSNENKKKKATKIYSRAIHYCSDVCDTTDGGIQTSSIQVGMSACMCARVCVYRCIYVYSYEMTVVMHVRMCV